MSDTENNSEKKNPVVLIIADGLGLTEPGHESVSAIHGANAPTLKRLIDERSKTPSTKMWTNGPNAGLPEGQCGNSEAGHEAIGSGRAVPQYLDIINQSAESGELLEKPEFSDAIKNLKQTGGTMHLAGIASDGAVHGHIDLLPVMAKVFSDQNIPVKIHAFTDGRDTPPGTASGFIENLNEAIKDLPNVNIATVTGRADAMDRNKDWGKTESTFEAIIQGTNTKNPMVQQSPTAASAITQAAARSETDEFIAPTVVGDYKGFEAGKDGLLMANYRKDRALQLGAALTERGFKEFERSVDPNPAAALSMALYSQELNTAPEGQKPPLQPLFSRDNVEQTLSDVLEENGLTQLHTAETEKYAHVTFFFNGGRQGTLPGEEHVVVPSPKEVNGEKVDGRYDRVPEMAAHEVTSVVLDAIENSSHDVVIVNFANADMVGHSGQFGATVQAVEAVDESISNIEQALKKTGGVGLVIADHGNSERTDTTAHTTGPVPFAVIGSTPHISRMKMQEGDARLMDVAPTMLTLIELAKDQKIETPEQWTGRSMITIERKKSLEKPGSDILKERDGSLQVTSTPKDENTRNR